MNKYVRILVLGSVLFFLPKQVCAIEYTCCSISNYHESDSAELREKFQNNPTFENVYHYLTSIYRTEFGSIYLEKLNQAIILFPDSGQLHYLKGMVHTNQPTFNKKLISDCTISSEHFRDSLGIISFLKSAELNYMSGDSYNKVGSIFYYQRQFSKASFYLKKAIDKGVCCYEYSPSVFLTMLELETLQVDSAISTFKKGRAKYSVRFMDKLYFYLSADTSLKNKLLQGKWTFLQREALDDMYYRSLYNFKNIEVQSLKMVCDILDSTIVEQSETPIDTIFFNRNLMGNISPSKINNSLWKHLYKIVPNEQEGEVEVLEQNIYLRKEKLAGMSCNKVLLSSAKRTGDNTLNIYRRAKFGDYYYVFASFSYAGFHRVDLLFKFDEHGNFIDCATSTSVE